LLLTGHISEQVQNARKKIIEYIRWGDLELGAEMCQRVLAVEPADVQTAVRLALLLFRLQNPCKARDTLLLAAEHATDLAPNPRIIQIEVTRRCNLSCSMCPRTRSLQQASLQSDPSGLYSYWHCDLDPHLFSYLITQCPDAESVMLHGIGEPLLYPHLSKLVDVATERQLDVSFFSNGMLLTCDHSQMLIDKDVSKITFSIDGASHQVFERIRQDGQLDRFIENVRSLVALKHRLGSILPQVAFHITLSVDNRSEVSSILELAAEMEANEVSVSPIEPADTLIRSYQRDPSLLGQDLKRWRTFAKQLGLRLVSVGLDQYITLLSASKNQPGFCIWPWMGLYISVEGKVLPCCHLTNVRRYALGDIKTQRIDEIWNGESFRAFRKGILARNPRAGRCRSCMYFI
jgi:radical SAM protein with 4Fe4S-binding SPASM domain